LIGLLFLVAHSGQANAATSTDCSGSYASLIHESNETSAPRKEWLPNWLRPSEYNALIRYAQASSYKEISAKSVNKALRMGTMLTEKQKAYVETLSKALSRLEKYEGLVWRTVAFDEKNIAAYEALQEGAIFTDLGCMSTSAVRGYKHGNANVKFVIHSKTGRKLPGFPISYLREKEVLFDHGTRFRITRITDDPQMPEWKTYGQKTKVVEMEEIDPSLP
jgi:hypothetical protein